MRKRGKDSPSKAVSIAKKELKKKKRETLLEIIVLTVALVSTSTLFILLSINLIITGYASYAPSEPGYISELIVDLTYQTTYWGGLFGVAWRIPGYGIQPSETIYAGEIT